MLISNGSLCSNIQYQITSLEECRFASETLGLRWGGSRDGQDLSPACAYAVNANKVYYNLSPGTIQPPRFDALICRRAKGTISKINFCDGLQQNIPFTLMCHFIMKLFADCSDAPLSHLSSKSTMEDNGWVVDATFHSLTSNIATCSANTFYGWSTGSNIAQAVTKFRGNGGAKLLFGNCYNSGFVSVYLNDIQIGYVYSQGSDIVKFNYRKGDVISIKAHSVQASAILALYSLEITDWGKEK